MRVYRISKPDYAANALSGQGAALNPGRWNTTGTRLAYTAGSASLAMLEMLVHIDRHSVPAGLRLLSFIVPDDAIEILHDLPDGWDRLPYSPAVRAVGDAWIVSARSLALKVPSAVARQEFNVLVNPAHRRFAEIQLQDNQPLTLDDRLFAQT